MADLSGYKVDDDAYSALGVQGLADTPGLTTSAMQAKFDERCDLVESTYNTFIDGLEGMISDTVTNSSTVLPSGAAIVSYVQYMGGGDMTKATYDTDEDGVVDNSEALNGHSADYFAEDATVQPVNFIGFPYYSGNSLTSNGITFTVNEDGSVTVSGTASADATFFLRSRQEYGSDTALTLEEGETYTFSGCPSGGSSSTYYTAISYGNSSSWVAFYGTDTGSGATFTAGSEVDSYCAHLVITVKSGTDLSTAVTFYPQLEKGNVAHDYVPPMYHKNLATAVRNGNIKLGSKSLASGGTTYTISSPVFTTDSLVDVYYNEASKSIAQTASPTYTLANGSLTITFANATSGDITIDNIRVDNA